MESPLVSVIILTHKRLQVLQRVIHSIMRQDYPYLEAIVVDNGSRDGTSQYLRENYPSLKVVELSSNLGPCAGRNKGIEEAKGDILITLDDDVYFESSEEVKKIVKSFQKDRHIGCITFMIQDPYTGGLRLREWCHPFDYRSHWNREFETYYIPEGASAFRSKALREVGGYYEPYFIGCEGLDLAIRMMDRGYRILYTPSVRVWHLYAKEGRESWRPFYYYTRNYFWITWRLYPPGEGLRFLTLKLGMMFLHSVRKGKLRYFLRGVLDGLRYLPQIKHQRVMITPETHRKIKDFDSFRPGLFSRLMKHREEPQV